MKIKKIIAFVSLSIVMVGCNFNVTDMQDIEIDYYSDNEKNIKLTKDLMYYDPQYIASKVPALNEDTGDGIRLGYFIRSSDKKPSYRITYSLKNLSVASNIEELKKQFEDFIPKLAEIHASKEAVFVELEPVGERWIREFFSGSVQTLFIDSSTILKNAISQEKFLKFSSQFINEYSKPLEMSFVRAQYYEAFGEFPESVSLYYLTKFHDKKALMIRVSLNQENEKWLVMGINLEPINF